MKMAGKTGSGLPAVMRLQAIRRLVHGQAPVLFIPGKTAHHDPVSIHDGGELHLFIIFITNTQYARQGILLPVLLVYGRQTGMLRVIVQMQADGLKIILDPHRQSPVIVVITDTVQMAIAFLNQAEPTIVQGICLKNLVLPLCAFQHEHTSQWMIKPETFVHIEHGSADRNISQPQLPAGHVMKKYLRAVLRSRYSRLLMQEHFKRQAPAPAKNAFIVIKAAVNPLPCQRD